MTFLADPVVAAGILSGTGIVGGALALGLRHGIDWDHIAAITDITSTTTGSDHSTGDDSLTREPGVTFTDESHHGMARPPDDPYLPPVISGRAAADGGSIATLTEPAPPTLASQQKRALFLGTLYAVGHGTVVTLLGLLAILASGFLPGWIDPIMERVVGVTLIVLAAYLFYTLWGYFRGKGQFRLRSRWMLVFSAIKSAYQRVVGRLHGQHSHVHLEEGQQYAVWTAFAVGLVHGIGAETGTQVLVITSAVGADNDAVAVLALLTFVFGLIISNSIVTVMTTTGFASAQRRQTIYVAVGLLAAVFSLFMGLAFLSQSGEIFPDLDPYFRWIGGPD
jgi:hypothetical protein